MARAIAKVVPIAAPVDIGEWVAETAHVAIQGRGNLVARIEAESSTGSNVASRLAAAVVAGTDPRLILDSKPPPALPAEMLPDNPTDLFDELSEPEPPPRSLKQPQLSSGTMPTQLGASVSQRMDPPASPARGRVALVGAAVAGALIVLGVLRLTQTSVATPPATAAANAPPRTAEAPVVTAPMVAIPQAGAAAEPPPTATAAPADPAAPPASSAPAHAGVSPKVPAPRVAPRSGGAPRSTNQPRIDDPLLQAR